MLTIIRPRKQFPKQIYQVLRPPQVVLLVVFCGMWLQAALAICPNFRAHVLEGEVWVPVGLMLVPDFLAIPLVEFLANPFGNGWSGPTPPP